MSKFFIRRPIVAMVIAILTVIIGVISMLTLPTAQFPDIVPPEIMVQATYPGADAKTLTQAVATPIEQQVNGVDHMIYMDSVSANNGQATVYVDFDLKTNPDTDQVLTQIRVTQAQSQLPPEVNTAGLVVQKSLTSPLMVIALSSPDGSHDVNFLTNYAIINVTVGSSEWSLHDLHRSLRTLCIHSRELADFGSVPRATKWDAHEPERLLSGGPGFIATRDRSNGNIRLRAANRH